LPEEQSRSISAPRSFALGQRRNANRFDVAFEVIGGLVKVALGNAD
jgi:hypothetical protein